MPEEAWLCNIRTIKSRKNQARTFDKRCKTLELVLIYLPELSKMKMLS